MDLSVGERVLLDGEDVTEQVRRSDVTEAVSIVAAHPEVREELVRRQRAWVAANGGGVVEGRDIGSVVLPDADLKIFLTADSGERAARRAAEGPARPGRDRGDCRRDPASRRARLDSGVVPPGRPGGRRRGGLDGPERGVGSRGGALSPVKTPDAVTAPPSRAEIALYRVFRFVLVGLSRLYFPGTVTGRENLPATGAFIVAPVHRSYVDWLIVARITKRRLRYIVKEEVWKSKTIGRLLEMLGAFPVNRSGADREALERCRSVLAGGEPLVMFPEGTRGSGPAGGRDPRTVWRTCPCGPASRSFRSASAVPSVPCRAARRSRARGG